MKTILQIAIIWICLILLVTTCKDKVGHDSIKVVNNSDNAIYFDFSYRYPDTIPVQNPLPGRNYAKVLGHSSGKEQDRDPYEGTISGSRGGKIMCYIYDAHVLETTPWDTIVKYYMIVKRYDLTEQELNSMNWTITYPAPHDMLKSY